MNRYTQKKMKNAEKLTPCCHARCENVGEYPAPVYKDFVENDAPPPRQWFCLEHIRQFNKQWDFFEEMTFDEIDDFQTSTIRGESVREFTKRHGNLNVEEVVFEQASRLRDGDEAFFSGEGQSASVSLSEEMRMAMRKLGVSMPLQKEEVKQSYYRLAKKYHPDKVGQEGEGKLKEINRAYNTIKDHLKRYEHA